MWTPANGDQGYASASLIDGGYYYAYNVGSALSHHVARVPLGHIRNSRKWEFYSGSGSWSHNRADSKSVFTGGDDGETVFYDSYLQEFVAVYVGFPDTTNRVGHIFARVATKPEGPWSGEMALATIPVSPSGGYPYCLRVHPEFSLNGGETFYLTYTYWTAHNKSVFPIWAVTVQKP